MQRLVSVPLLGHCSKRELRAIAGIADEIELSQGYVLCREGEAGLQCFFLLEGEVEVRRGGRRIAKLGAGDVVGEMALLSLSPRIATVTALTPLRALVVTSGTFLDLLDASPAIQAKVTRSLADRIAAASI